MRTLHPTRIRLAGWISALAFPLAASFAALFAAAAQAQPADAIGTVLAVKGTVEAHDAAGTTRALRRGAEVFEADTIVVGSDAYAQIRMVDDATIALKSDTEFTFGTYDYDGNAATPDSATMSMLRGGFRTISGSIGDADEDTYRIDTPYASIGIRGTMHSGVIVDNVLFTGVYDGGTTISNIQGSLNAGIGADFDYTETLGGVAPRGLVEAPPELSLVDLATQFVQLAPAGTPVVGDTDAEAQNDATEPAPAFAALANPAAATQAGNANANVTAPQRPAADLAFVNTLAGATTAVTGGDPQDDVNPVLFSRAATELDATPATGGGNNNGNAGGNNGNGNSNSNAGGNNGNGSGNSNAGGNNGNGNSNAGGNNGNGNGNGNAGGNNGNGNGNSNAGGNNGNGNGNSNAGGNNGNGNGNSNAGGNNGNGNGNSNADGNNGNGNGNGNNNPGRGNDNGTRPIAARVFGIAGTDETAFPATSLVLGWGVWDSAMPVAGNHIRRSIGLFFNTDAARAVIIPADMADLSGIVNYASTGNFAGTDATGSALRDVQMTFDVNLAGGPGAITNGQLHVLDSRQQAWSAAFNGDVSNASATMIGITGSYGSNPLAGAIQGVFTGTGAQPDFVSGFVLQSDAEFVQGITELSADLAAD